MAVSADAAAVAAVAASFWNAFGLDAYRKDLDDRGLAIAAAQEASLKGRRQLADLTKGFRKDVAAEVSKAAGPLLKAYQEEIDRLTGRAKAGEAAFLDVYQKLYEAPDPAPALSAGLDAAQRLVEVEARAAKVAAELADFKAESAQLRNQDLTVRRLEERAKALEAHLAEKDKELEAAAARPAITDAPSAEEVAEREAALEAALTEARRGLDNMRRLHQAAQNQLFTLQSDRETAAAGREEEADVAAAEVDAAQRRLAGLEAEKDALLAQVERMRSNGGGSPTAAAASSSSSSSTLEQQLRSELASQRGVIARLRGEAAAATEAAEAAEARAADAERDWQLQLAERDEQIADLQQRLSARATPEEVKELRLQLRALQVVSGLGGADDAGSDAGSTADSGGGGGLEAMLVDKARRCEHEATVARLAAAQAKDEAQAAAGHVAELEAEVERLQRLTTQLEEDLAAAATSGDGMAGRSGSGGGEAAAGDMLAAAAGGSDGGGGNGAPSGGDRSMLDVLCAQRDRLRDRVTRLEEGTAALGQQLTKARAQLDAARADNVALVERLKYVQGFAGSRKQGSGAAEPPAVQKYSASYSASVDPFAAWRARAAEERRASMGIHDRMLYSAAQLVAAHPAARLFVCIYTLLLHFLVFALLSRAAHHHSAAERLCAMQHHMVHEVDADSHHISDPIAAASLARGVSSGAGSIMAGASEGATAAAKAASTAAKTAAGGGGAMLRGGTRALHILWR